MQPVSTLTSSECLFARRLAEDPDRLHAVSMQVLLHCGATLNHAMASLGRGETTSINEFRERAQLMSVQGIIVAEIRRRNLAYPPPDAA
jgi:hypothetical protein